MVDYFEERGINASEDADARRARLESHIMRLMADFNLFEELGMPNQLAPPASKEVVKNLVEEKIAKSNSGKCDICLKEYEIDEITKVMPCKHKFHSECIDAWLSKTNSCPLCRYELPTDDKFYEDYRKEKKRAKERDADIANLHNSMFS